MELAIVLIRNDFTGFLEGNRGIVIFPAGNDVNEGWTVKRFCGPVKIINKHFNIPFEVCKERYLKAKRWTKIEKIEIEDFFERMRYEFDEPTLDEGFDQIVTLSQDFLLEMM